MSTPLQLWDIQLFIGNHKIPATTATPKECSVDTFVSLLFTNHKNRVKGKSTGHGTTGHHGTTTPTPLAIMFHKNKWKSFRSTGINMPSYLQSKL